MTDLQNRSTWLGYSSVQPPPIPPRFFEISDGSASCSEVDTPGALWFCDGRANTMTREGIDAFAKVDNTNFCLHEVSSRPWKCTNCRRQLNDQPQEHQLSPWESKDLQHGDQRDGVQDHRLDGQS